MSTSTAELIDSNKMYHALLKAGEEWADTKAAYHALDDVTASILADVTQSYRGSNAGRGELSRAEAETMARFSPVYHDHLASVAVAHKAFLRAQVRYDSLKTLIELRRSEESTRRQEMRL